MGKDSSGILPITWAHNELLAVAYCITTQNLNIAYIKGKIPFKNV